MALRYKAGIMKALKEKGYSSTRLRKEKIFGESAMQDMRSQADIRHQTLNQLCAILGCSIEDIVEYVPDDPQGPQDHPEE